MRRILSVLAVVVLMVASMFSAPTAIAQGTSSASQVSPDRHGAPFFACYKGTTRTFHTRHARRDFLRKHNSAKIGPC
jgi:hypothetical protein